MRLKGDEMTRSEESIKRLEWLDVARSFAICAVVLCHCVEQFYSFSIEGVSNLTSLSKWFMFSAHTIGRMGVPIFLFLTGYLLLGKYGEVSECLKFWKTKLIPLIVTAQIWIIFYNIFISVYYGQQFEIDTLFRNMLFVGNVAMSHTWYLPMIIGMYFLLPFVSSVLNKFPIKIINLVLVVSIIYSFVVPFVNQYHAILRPDSGVVISPVLNLSFAGGIYAVYWVIGYYFKRGIFEKVKAVTWLIGFLFFYVLTVVFQVWAFSKSVAYLNWYDLPLLLLTTICLFGLFSRFPQIRFQRFFKSLSICSFGIYLVHYPVMRVVRDHFMPNVMNGKAEAVVMLTLITLVISFLFVCVASKNSVLRKYLFLIKTK